MKTPAKLASDRLLIHSQVIRVSKAVTSSARNVEKITEKNTLKSDIPKVYQHRAVSNRNMQKPWTERRCKCIGGKEENGGRHAAQPW